MPAKAGQTKDRGAEVTMLRDMLQRVRALLASKSRSPSAQPSPGEGHSLPWQDTLAAIADLQHMAEENPGALTIHMALGNLYRAQGDLDRAIAVRNEVLNHSDLPPEQRGRILLELGRDYKRSGLLDRAQNTFQATKDILGRDPALLEEMASLAAAGNDHEHAAQLFAEVNRPVAQAHYLVEQAKSLARNGRRDRGAWLLRKAVKVYPGSVEAWMERMIQAYENGSWKDLASHFGKGLTAVEPRLRFLLLEGLIQHLFTQRNPHDLFSPVLLPEGGQALVQVIATQSPDVHLLYYGAWIHLQLGDIRQAQAHLQKCCQLDPEFWPARLELLALYADKDPISPACREHLEYILQQGRQVKKFVCAKCGLKLDQIFFLCPRCRSWHSIAFLKTLDS